MAELVLDAQQVGDIVTYVAPGFLAQLGYRARFPAPECSTGQTLVASVVLSFPLVALAQLVGSHKPTSLGYVALLTAGSFLVGYIVACLRAKDGVKTTLSVLGYRSPPESSIYAQTLMRLGPKDPVDIQLKDGRHIYGTPRVGPHYDGDGINELYLTHPEARIEGGVWQSAGDGIIVPLAEISTIALFVDPTTPTPKVKDTAIAEGRVG